MDKVILIRHAESESNVGGVFEHQHTVKITSKGKTQAKDLSEVLDMPDRIICSRFIRTIETAEPLMHKFPNAETHIWIETHEFQPLDTRRYAGATTEVRDEIAREYWSRMDPLFHDGGNSESFKDLVDRVNVSILKMNNLHGINYIFTHANFIRCLLVLLNDYPDFNKQQNKDYLYLQIMQKFEESYLSGNLPIKNTEIFDVSELLGKYS